MGFVESIQWVSDSPRRAFNAEQRSFGPRVKDDPRTKRESAAALCATPLAASRCMPSRGSRLATATAWSDFQQSG